MKICLNHSVERSTNDMMISICDIGGGAVLLQSFQGLPESVRFNEYLRQDRTEGMMAMLLSDP